ELAAASPGEAEQLRLECLLTQLLPARAGAVTPPQATGNEGESAGRRQGYSDEEREQRGGSAHIGAEVAEEHERREGEEHRADQLLHERKMAKCSRPREVRVPTASRPVAGTAAR